MSLEVTTSEAVLNWTRDGQIGVGMESEGFAEVYVTVFRPCYGGWDSQSITGIDIRSGSVRLVNRIPCVVRSVQIR